MGNKRVCKVCGSVTEPFEIDKTECSSDDIFYKCHCPFCGCYLMTAYTNLFVGEGVCVDKEKFRNTNLLVNKDGRYVAWVNSAFTYSDDLKAWLNNAKAEVKLIEDVAF